MCSERRRPKRIRSGRVAATVVVLGLTFVGAVAAERSSPDANPVDFARIRVGLAHIGLTSITGERVAIQWLGSGFVVDDRCTAATARHILEGVDPDRLIVRILQNGEGEPSRTFQARLLYEDGQNDLAFLAFGGGELGKRFCRSKNVLPFSLVESIDPHRLTGEPVLVAGFPMLEGEQPKDQPILRRGIVASAEMEWREGPMLLLDLTGVPGFSGSPVIRVRDGVVVGVVYGPGRTRRQYDLEWATPITREDYARIRAQQKE